MCWLPSSPSQSGFTGRFSSLLMERAHRQIKDTLSRCSVLLSQYLRDNPSRTRFVFGTILRGTSTEFVPLCILCHIVDRTTVDGVSRDLRAPSVRRKISTPASIKVSKFWVARIREELSLAKPRQLIWSPCGKSICYASRSAWDIATRLILNPSMSSCI